MLKRRFIIFETLLENLDGSILIFARMFGIFIFNPIFARRNIPSYVKIGTTLALAIFFISITGGTSVSYDNVPQFAIAVLLEGFVGVILGFLTQLFLSTILVAGEVMDMQAGLGMAKIYDSANGVQMSLFGTIMTYMFILYFFVTNAHLSYIKIFFLSYEIIPLGFESINSDVGIVIVEYFAVVLGLAVKLALPFMVASLLLEFSMGILMKVVPQIQVMQVNIQIKLLFGLGMMFLLAVPLSNAIDKYIDILIQNLEGILPLLTNK